jgi:hypothetical protein
MQVLRDRNWLQLFLRRNDHWYSTRTGVFLNSFVISKVLDNYLPFECNSVSFYPLCVTLTRELRFNDVSLDFAAWLARCHFSKLSSDYCRLSYISNQGVFLSQISSFYVLLYLTRFSHILILGREEWEDYLAGSWSCC